MTVGKQHKSRNEAQKRYLDRRPEQRAKLYATMKKWRDCHKEEIRAYNRAYYNSHKI